jgi:hypothetical protein
VCENLEVMRDAGWTHLVHPQEGVVVRVELTANSPHSGNSALRLAAEPNSDEAPPPFLESAPVWVVTPPIAFKSAQIVRIHGWARVVAPIRASVDGLMIIDSFGGEALAARIGQTNGWQEFALYRAATSDGDLTVTFALTGLGAAELDDLTVEAVVMNSPDSGRAFNPTTTDPVPVR